MEEKEIISEIEKLIECVRLCSDMLESDYVDGYIDGLEVLKASINAASRAGQGGSDG